MGGCFTKLLLISILACLSVPASAHETDNYTVPRDKQFVDLGPIFTDIFCLNIRKAVEYTNRRIRHAIELKASAQTVAQLQSPGQIARAVRHAFPPTISMIDDIERMIFSKRMRDQYPGLITGYIRFSCIYDHASFILDPRQVFKLWRAPTVMINGTYLGTDKLGHFISKGYINYDLYRKALKTGASREEAVKQVLELGTGNDIFYSEKGFVGYLSSGVYSNADLVSDYVGLAFYRNLTEPVRLRGNVRPPMLIRRGDYWEIAPHVRRDSDFFTVYITDHLDEVMNPNLMEAAMRKPVRKAIKRRSDNLLKWYADRHGNRRTKADFDRYMIEYSTYFGEEYGHSGEHEKMVTITNTCLVPFEFSDDVKVSAPNGETGLHDAAGRGDAPRVKRLIRSGADVNAPVRSLETYSSEWGNTPLHHAAQDGRTETAEILIANGAEVSARNDNGVTPLHRAVRHADMVSLLIGKGATVNADDALGRTPLHWSAAYPDPAVVELLFARGADIHAKDHNGRTPLHNAALWGHTQVIQVLLARGADVNATADLGVTPLHVAAQKNHVKVVELLLRNKADANATDEFGWTPLHDAAARNRNAVAKALLAGGATVNVKDAYGSTPLHEAARQNNHHMAGLLLANGADVRAANQSGRTALHDAAFNGHNKTVELLTAKGGDIHRKDNNGVTPHQLAAESKLTVAELFSRIDHLR